VTDIFRGSQARRVLLPDWLFFGANIGIFLKVNEQDSHDAMDFSTCVSTLPSVGASTGHMTNRAACADKKRKPRLEGREFLKTAPPTTTAQNDRENGHSFSFESKRRPQTKNREKTAAGMGVGKVDSPKKRT
jgi:hypothetical protein